MKTRHFLLLAAVAAAPAFAGTFDGGIPAAWRCHGRCGTSPADGVVPLAPGGGSAYAWVSSAGSTGQAALPGVGGTGGPSNGSSLRSVSFNAAAGSALDFHFDYVTSDGADFGDYAWTRLLDADNTPVALLVTARSNANGNTIPGFDMPAPEATLTPFPVEVAHGQTLWSPLGTSSDRCYGSGACGATGWVRAQYEIADAGTYRLEFGVTNWNDHNFDSGLAFDAITVDGAPLPVPQPAQYAMLLAGLALLGRLKGRPQ
ncbi:NF038132 family protein [Pseudoduganella violaceinigra]|uniref:NF038132 family protein n=1 Tax=Pseudoduganella violaceinigra TaxID=246602 RepID=UPI00047F49A6|nr:NF038132 family protein [Pseudoduganella violaceinigra]